MKRSISFDRAADIYDETRALPPELASRIVDAIAAEVRRAGADRVLELGIGTGRIARPLAEQGLRVTGVDISARMLERLVAQAEPGAAIDVLLGDVTRLPLASGTFRAALFVHVLHLIPEWETALAETARTLAQGGVLLRYHERYVSETLWGERGRAKWRELFALRGFTPRHRPSDDEIHEALRGLGASVRVERVAESEDRRTPAAIMDVTRRRVNSWTWEVPDDVFEATLPEYEAWVAEQFPMEEELVDTVVHELEVWRFP